MPTRMGANGPVGSQQLSRAVVARARELGFEKVGIAPAGEARRSGALRDWLRLGRHGEMGYLARDPEMRADPTRRDPWARSIVSVAMNYLPARGEWGAAPGVLGRIARYAAGDDYHDVMKSRLEQLLEFVNAEAPGTRGRVAVDTSPILEREFGEAAGVGWLAKNTMVIDEQIGSWTFLGELILDRELESATPPEDLCGTCRACIDACPTEAILEDRTMDATRCISYWTIELRGSIPRNARGEVGGHLFGCDICQEVCPYNRDAVATTEPAFRPRTALAAMNLADVARLTEEGFRAAFAGSSIRRAKRRGIVRNAFIAGANAADDAVLNAAPEALTDPDPVVRVAAGWALGRRGGKSSKPLVEGAARREEDAGARADLLGTLDEWKD